MSKILTAVLGDFYHDKDIAIRSLESAIEHLRKESSLEIEINYLSVNALVDSLEEKSDLVILFAENRLNPVEANVKTWMKAEDAEMIEKYVKSGGSWLAWHAGLASYESIEQYIGMLRGHFLHHPAIHQMVEYATNPSANILETDEQFKFLDEHYFVHVEEDQTNVFLKSDSIDGSSLAGWRHRHGEGKVLCLTPAHLEAGLLDGLFLKVLAQSIKWCL